MYLFDKTELVNYIIDYYKKLYNEDISPVKLQKGLYLLFAKWGGYIYNGKAEDVEFRLHARKHEFFELQA